jgi:NAD-dependent SIR2 family protein deacetylase
MRVNLRPWYGPGIHDAAELQPNSIHLLKLHGSANWAFCPKCKKPVVLYHKVTRLLGSLPQPLCPECDNLRQPLLVPPSWDKTEYSDTMSPVWKLAVEKLKCATRICVVGYSIPESDAFFRHMITLALADNQQLERLIVVDKDTNIETKWEKLLDPVFCKRRFRFYGQAFQLYLAGRSSCSDLSRGDYIRDNRLYGTI